MIKRRALSLSLSLSSVINTKQSKKADHFLCFVLIFGGARKVCLTRERTDVYLSCLSPTKDKRECTCVTILVARGRNRTIYITSQ